MNTQERTGDRTLSAQTPGVARVKALESEIQGLRAEQASVIDSIVDDAQFMDIPVRTLSSYEIEARDDESRSIGTTWHMLSQLSERDNYTRHFAHRAGSCDGAWCSTVEVPQRPKYERAGSRHWHTFHGPHVLVGVRHLDGGVREYVFAPTDSASPSGVQ